MTHYEHRAYRSQFSDVESSGVMGPLNPSRVNEKCGGDDPQVFNWPVLHQDFPCIYCSQIKHTAVQLTLDEEI